MEANFSIAILGYVWPEPVSSAAGVRTLGLVDALLQSGEFSQITFLSPAKDNAFAEQLRKKGLKTYQISANDPAFDSLIRELNPSHVMFDRFVLEEQFGWRVREQCPEALRIIDTQDLHFLRRARENTNKNGASTPLANEDAYREIAAIYRSDSSFILSNYEMDLLTQQFQLPSDLLKLVRFFYPKQETPFETEKSHFSFIGNYRHPPNHDGVQWLCKEIWPLVRRKLPHAELHLFGAYPPKEISALHAPKNGIHFFGPAENQYTTLAKYRVNLAPLRFGAGIKGKIADGWQCGTPCVSTSIGAEGMGYSIDSSWGGLIANSTEAFAEATIALHEEPALWQSCQKRGLELMEELFSWEKNASDFIQHLEVLWHEKETRRQKNFIGQMLWHHSLQSTKYLSRWIEEKNKKAQA